MRKYKWSRQVGCGLPVISLIALVIWVFAGYQGNEQKNEYANKEYQKLCSEELLLDNENRKKWQKLERDVLSGLIDTRLLSIDINKYEGSFDKYQDVLGKLESVKGFDNLFYQKIFLKYGNENILYFDNVIVIKNNFFPSFLSLGFVARSCYGETEKYDRLIGPNF